MLAPPPTDCVPIANQAFASCRTHLGYFGRGMRATVREPEGSPLDVEDVRHAHELLAERNWQVSELFAA